MDRNMEYAELEKSIGMQVLFKDKEKGKPIIKTVTLTGLQKSTVSPKYDVCYFRNPNARVDMIGLCSQIIDVANK